MPLNNSILNYFKPKSSPKVDGATNDAKKEKTGGGSGDGANGGGGGSVDVVKIAECSTPTSAKKRPRLKAIENRDLEDTDGEGEDDDDEVISRSAKGKASKRRRIVVMSDSSDEDEKDSTMKEEKKRRDTPSVCSTPKSVQKKLEEIQRETPSKSFLEMSSQSAAMDTSSFVEQPELSFPHLTHAFLQEDKMRDANGNRKGDDDYDPTTLKVPSSFLDQQTPAQRQWWEIKRQNLDTVLFFKMGKFYELFHMDAVIAVEQCQLIYMKKDYAHCGFPEAAFQRYANVLIEKGHKVARIEQTETPKMMEARCKKLARPATKFDKVVQRKICQRITIGTRTFHDGEDEHLMAIYEDRSNSSSNAVGGRPTVGVCICNPGLSKVFFGQFEDDTLYSRTLSLLSFVTVSEMLYQRSALSPALWKLLSNFSAVRKSTAHFPSAEDAVKGFMESSYFANADTWPESMNKALESGSYLSLVRRILAVQFYFPPVLDIRTPRDSSRLAWSAIGAVMRTLKDAMVDHDVLALGDINNLEALSSVMGDGPNKDRGKSMILFGDTTRNLDLLPVQQKGSESKFNLFSVLNHTSTAFGKRLLRQWVCNPLLRPADIVERQEAIADMENSRALVADAKKAMKKFCDFEKYVSAIFAAGQKKESHPNSEAIFYENNAQLKRNINYLISSLTGFESACRLLQRFRDNRGEFASAYMRRLCESDLAFVDELEEVCRAFRDAFDFQDALEKSRIIPSDRGVDADYDAVKDKMDALEKKANGHLKEQRDHFGTSDIKFWGTGNNAYQLEVPERQAEKRAGREHTFSSQRKGYKRYLTSVCEQLREMKTELEEEERSVFEKIHSNMFNRFCTHRALWRRVVHVLSVIDCLASLRDYSYGIDGDSCFPEILDGDDDVDTIEITKGKHPLLATADFIPNDVTLKPKVFILTGANMGGKSTVMRQTALLAVLAQLGCKVPAEAMSLKPVDKVFSRMVMKPRFFIISCT